jgi:hypothetical protein
LTELHLLSYESSSAAPRTRQRVPLLQAVARAKKVLMQARRRGGSRWVIAAMFVSTVFAQQSTMIRFSGYDWNVKTSPGRAGPGPNYFSADNVRVDGDGRLHLRVAQVDGRWVCAEVICSRSLGYGEYRFTVTDTAGLAANVILGLFTWDTNAPNQHYREIDIEVSRWGDPAAKNGQFVIQPYSRPENIVRFEIPPGRTLQLFEWAAGRVSCRSEQAGVRLREHVFTRGIPSAGGERARINLWLFGGSAPADGRENEVVIESFSFRR